MSSLLNQIQIAKPCSASWEAMDGDDRRRMCAKCGLRVYNISSMTNQEANTWLETELATGQRVCGRLFRRQDGTILTRDCPVGIRAVRLRVVRSLAAAAAFIFGGAALTVFGAKLGDWAKAKQIESMPIMGAMCIPATNTGVTPPASGEIGN